jgi:hypothetical protein
MNAAVAIHEDQPINGTYKMRDGDRWLPVAIWTHEGRQVARVGAEMRDPLAIWLWVAKFPVDREDCRIAMTTGKWPGDAPEAVVALSETTRPGDNGAPLDPFEELTREVDEEHERVQAWIAEGHTGPRACEQAANWLEKLRQLKAKVFDGFDAEKEEVRKEGQRIDVKWRGVKLTAGASTTCLQSYLDEIGRVEQKRLQEAADAKAQEEAARRAAEAAMIAEAQGIEAPSMQVEGVKAEPVKVAYGGLHGKKIAPRKAKPTATVNDWKVAAAHYSDNAKVRELIQRLASADAAEGVEAPGTTINLPN